MSASPAAAVGSTISPTAALIRGGIAGLAIAFTFALVIRVLPAALFVPRSGWLAVAYVVGALAGPPTVWAVGLVTRTSGPRLTPATAGGLVGALAFDGLAVGFVPALYGQAEMGSVGGVLLWAFCCYAASIVAMTGVLRS